MGESQHLETFIQRSSLCPHSPPYFHPASLTVAQNHLRFSLTSLVPLHALPPGAILSSPTTIFLHLPSGSLSKVPASVNPLLLSSTLTPPHLIPNYQLLPPSFLCFFPLVLDSCSKGCISGIVLQHPFSCLLSPAGCECLRAGAGPSGQAQHLPEGLCMPSVTLPAESPTGTPRTLHGMRAMSITGIHGPFPTHILTPSLLPVLQP